MNLKKWLDKNGWTQRGFSDKHGFDRGGFNRLVNGYHMPRVRTLRLIYQVTGGQVTAVDMAKAYEQNRKEHG